MASSPYSQNEPQDTIIQEETWLQGTLLCSVLFGIQSTLSIWAFIDVLKRRSPSQGRMRITLLMYIAILFAVTTVAQGLSFDWIQMGFITQRGYPGGPSAFFNDEYSNGANLVATLLAVFSNWLMESLMVWRCKVVCSTAHHLWWVGVAIPLLLLGAVFVTGSLFIHNILHTAPQTVYVLAYGITSLFLNLTTTGFIAGRLFVHRYRVVSQLGSGHGRHYVGIAAVVVESAAVYSGFLVIVIVAYAIGSPATNLLQQLVVQVQAIASLLIILRIARGEGWSGSTDSQKQSAVVSSWDTRFVPPPDQNMIQLEVLSMRPDEEAVSMWRKEDEGSPCFSQSAPICEREFESGK